MKVEDLIINLTQHAATAEQIAAGVEDVTGDEDRKVLLAALTFDFLPTRQEIEERAAALAYIASRLHYRAMIGGAPYLMGPLERALREAGVEPVYAFSRRESVDQPQPDGSVRKVAVFRHAGFIPA